MSGNATTSVSTTFVNHSSSYRWHFSKQEVKTASMLISALVMVGGLIWAGASHNTEVNFHAFQPLHLAAMGAVLLTGSAHRLGKAYNYSGTTLITTLLGFFTLLGGGSAISHAAGHMTETYVLLGAMGITALGIFGKLHYDRELHDLATTLSSFQGNEPAVESRPIDRDPSAS